jgi:hypothetical protein
VYLIVTDRTSLRPARLGLELAAALFALHPQQFEIDAAARLLGSRDALERIKKGEDPASVAASWSDGEARWRLMRAKYLLY